MQSGQLTRKLFIDGICELIGKPKLVTTVKAAQQMQKDSAEATASGSAPAAAAVTAPSMQSGVKRSFADVDTAQEDEAMKRQRGALSDGYAAAAASAEPAYRGGGSSSLAAGAAAAAAGDGDDNDAPGAAVMNKNDLVDPLALAGVDVDREAQEVCLRLPTSMPASLPCPCPLHALSTHARSAAWPSHVPYR